MQNKKLLIPLLLIPLLLAFAFPLVSGAVAYNKGDVFAGVGAGKIKHFTPDGVLLETLDTTTGSNEQTGMAFDTAGNLYATDWTASKMSKFDNMGNLVDADWGGPFNSHPESIAIDVFGNLYVGQADGTEDILKFSSAEALLDSYNPDTTVGRGSDWIDLSVDQVTMLYTSEGTLIKRFDVGSDTQLSNFATLPGGPAYALRIRPNGEVMVAASNNVYRLDSAGVVIQTYPKPVTESSFLFALNLDPDGTSFWTAGYGSGNIYRIDIATGNVIKTFNADKFTTLAGLAVFGEITAVIPPPIDQVIPEVPLGTVIAGIAMAIGFVAYAGNKPLRLHRRK